MPLDIKFTGPMFNLLKQASRGEFDEDKAVELAAGKKFGGALFGHNSTIPKEEYTQSLVDYSRGGIGRVMNKDAAKRITALNELAKDSKSPMPSEDLVINPVNMLTALACLEKTEEVAALKILRLYFALKRAEYAALDKAVAGYFGGKVRTAVSGGWVEVGKQKFYGTGGMALVSDATLKEIAKEIKA